MCSPDRLRTEEFYRKAQDIIKSFTWLKVIFLGDAGVGKTSIIKSFYGVNITDDYYPTIGVDYGHKLYQSKNQAITKDIRVNIWDFSGDPNFLETRRELYINTDIIFVVCDLTNFNSLNNIHKWIKEFSKYGNQNLESVDICLLGNKDDDLNDKFKQINMDDLIKLSRSIGALRVKQISAKTGSGLIKEIFNEMIELRIESKLKLCNNKQN